MLKEKFDLGRSLAVSRGGLHERVTNEIGLRIVRGDLEPGQVLPNESELGTQLGVGRSVMREAIKVLASKGFVASRPKIGTTVQPRSNWNLLDADVLSWRARVEVSPDFVRDLTDLRSIIEPAAAERAATRATAAQIERLEYWYARMEVTIGDTEAFIDADMAFHSEILNACHNEMLSQVAVTIHAGLVISRRITTRLPNSSIASLPLHRAVIDAIRARDGLAASEAMRRLIARTEQDIRDVLGAEAAALQSKPPPKKASKRARI